jgi:hypothetical protein
LFHRLAGICPPLRSFPRSYNDPKDPFWPLYAKAEMNARACADPDMTQVHCVKNRKYRNAEIFCHRYDDGDCHRFPLKCSMYAHRHCADCGEAIMAEGGGGYDGRSIGGYDGDVCDRCGSLLCRECGAKRERPYRVHLGGRRYRRFASVAEANDFCERYRQRTKIILSVESVRAYV